MPFVPAEKYQRKTPVTEKATPPATAAAPEAAAAAAMENSQQIHDVLHQTPTAADLDVHRTPSTYAATNYEKTAQPEKITQGIRRHIALLQMVPVAVALEVEVKEEDNPTPIMRPMQ